MPSSPSPSHNSFHTLDSEVQPPPERRIFAAQYKLKILPEADNATESGQIAALLRREGLYSSHLAAGRKARKQALTSALSDQSPAVKAKIDPAIQAQLEQLKQDNKRRQARLEPAEKRLDIQKKVSERLGMPLTPPGSEKSNC
jgi:hypothetical protein